MRIVSTYQTTAGTTHELVLTGADCIAIVAAADTLFSWLVAPARSELAHGTAAKCHALFGHSSYLTTETLRMDRVNARDYAALVAVTG